MGYITCCKVALSLQHRSIFNDSRTTAVLITPLEIQPNSASLLFYLDSYLVPILAICLTDTMGFLGVIPAEELSAFYDPVRRTLTLSAKGEVQEFTYGFKFFQLPWVGGWKFELRAWSGPHTGHLQPYSFTQKFDLYLVPFPKDVIIVTANNFGGASVEIHYGGLLPTGQIAQIPTPREEAEPAKEVATGPNRKLNVLFREAFGIVQNAEVPKFGTIDIAFDKRYLELDDAGINNNQLVWTFNSLETGDTQVVITIRGGIKPFIQKIIYDVHIFVLDLPAQEEHPRTGDGESMSHILGFLGRVHIATRIVQETYPEAVLYNVVASTTLRPGVESPYLLTQMKVMFRDQERKGTIVIESNGYGKFKAPVFHPGVIIGNANIDEPVEMDAIQADKILKAEGYTGPYTSLTLLQPLYPGVDGPSYVFHMFDGIDRWVSVKEKKVLGLE